MALPSTTAVTPRIASAAIRADINGLEHNRSCRFWVLVVSKRFAGMDQEWARRRHELSCLCGFDYALVATISGRMPIMFMTRVRL